MGQHPWNFLHKTGSTKMSSLSSNAIFIFCKQCTFSSLATEAGTPHILEHLKGPATGRAASSWVSAVGRQVNSLRNKVLGYILSSFSNTLKIPQILMSSSVSQRFMFLEGRLSEFWKLLGGYYVDKIFTYFDICHQLFSSHMLLLSHNKIFRNGYQETRREAHRILHICETLTDPKRFINISFSY